MVLQPGMAAQSEIHSSELCQDSSAFKVQGTATYTDQLAVQS